MSEIRPPSTLSLKTGRLLRLTRKELRETLRDRRTVITLVLMPLLVYPLLSITFQKSLVSTFSQQSRKMYSIAVATSRDREILQVFLAEGHRIWKQRQTGGADKSNEQAAQDATGDADASLDDFEIDWLTSQMLESHVANLDVQVAVRLAESSVDGRDGRRFGPLRCTILYRPNSNISRETLRFVEERLQLVNEMSLRERLRRIGASSRVPAEFGREPIEATGETAFSLATLVPLVLILMTITGAVYPAIDLTAGERERKTLETLIAAPISRVSLLLAKYVAVVTVAVLTAMINLLAMTVTILSSGLGPFLFPEGISFAVLSNILGLLMLFAAFFSAVLLTLTSFARSFKEAQAYLIPVMLLAISPGVLSLMPGIELNGLLAVTPLVNIVLLARDLLEGNMVPGLAALAILSTIVYAAVAITVASKIFGNDAVLYASRGSWSELFLRPSRKQELPTWTTTLTCLVVMFPIYFVAANLARVPSGEVGYQLWINAVVTILVFGGCPLLFAIGQRVRIVSGFRLHGASPLAMLGAAIAGLALWPFAHEIFLFGKWIGITALYKDQFAATERLLQEFRGLPLSLILVTLAVVPATLEEFFFRGYLFSGLSERFKGARVVLASGLLFGLFHVLTPSVLTPERFLPSSFLGIILAWVCYRSGSIFPGILLHGVHNSLLLLLATHQEWLVKLGWDVQGQEHIPAAWLAASLLVASFGALLVLLGTRRSSP
jgi:sodium transport system permease protein